MVWACAGVSSVSVAALVVCCDCRVVGGGGARVVVAAPHYRWLSSHCLVWGAVAAAVPLVLLGLP